MTEINSDSIGRRIARYRRIMGIDTAKELAARISSDNLSESVIQNIESGRKADLSVSQLLNISRGIGISPVLLLGSIDRPFEKLDLVGLSPAMATMTFVEMDSWISASGNDSLGNMNTYGEFNQQVARRDLRDLLVWYGYWLDEMDAKPASRTDLSEEERMQVLAMHEANGKRIAGVYRRLSAIVDVSWAKGPWANDG
jgi:transcriptional regulator with XRE-family HTH domain